MGNTAFKDMTPQQQRQFKQRQVLIQEAIDKGSFRDRKDVKAWLKDFFNLSGPVSDISTEYSLTEKQSKLFYMWLLHFTGKGPRPHTSKPRAKISTKQLHRIDQLQDQLGWDSGELTGFVKHQTGKRKLVPSLWKYEATKLITGMERILAEQPFKAKG